MLGSGEEVAPRDAAELRLDEVDFLKSNELRLPLLFEELAGGGGGIS